MWDFFGKKAKAEARHLHTKLNLAERLADTCPFCKQWVAEVPEEVNTRPRLVAHLLFECLKNPVKAEALRLTDVNLELEDKLIVKERQLEEGHGVVLTLTREIETLKEKKNGWPGLDGGYIVRAKHDENEISCLVYFQDAPSKADVKEKIKKTLHASWKVCSIDAINKKGEVTHADQAQ